MAVLTAEVRFNVLPTLAVGFQPTRPDTTAHVRGQVVGFQPTHTRPPRDTLLTIPA